MRLCSVDTFDGGKGGKPRTVDTTISLAQTHEDLLEEAKNMPQYSYKPKNTWLRRDKCV